jgi:hypothetical protein
VDYVVIDLAGYYAWTESAWRVNVLGELHARPSRGVNG